MKATLIKKFGIHEKDTVLDANKKLYDHLLGGGWIKKPKPKVKK